MTALERAWNMGEKLIAAGRTVAGADATVVRVGDVIDLRCFKGFKERWLESKQRVLGFAQQPAHALCNRFNRVEIPQALARWRMHQRLNAVFVNGIIKRRLKAGVMATNLLAGPSV